MKVIVFDMACRKGIVAEGEYLGKKVDGDYTQVHTANNGAQLYHYGCVLVDTLEARTLVTDTITEYQRLENIAATYITVQLNKFGTFRPR